LNFPPSGYTADWYRDLIDDPRWGSAFRQSAITAVCSAVLSSLLATAAAIGMRDLRYRRLFEAFLLLPLIVPTVVVALMLYPLYVDVRLLGTTSGLVLAHTMLALPYAYLVINGAAQALDRRVELAAASLGASPWQVLIRVTAPMLLPAIAAAAVVSAVVSFDEVIVSIFLTDPQTRTVPVVMWSFVREEIRPTVAAASVVVMVANLTLLTLVSLFLRRGRRTETPAAA
jgi:putative spermidine/putrescine transport system permease protein